MVEGVNVLDAALDGEADIEALFAAPEAEAECPALLDRAAGRGIPVHRLGPGVLERVAGTVTPQPVLAVARRRPLALADVDVGGGLRTDSSWWSASTCAIRATGHSDPKRRGCWGSRGNLLPRLGRRHQPEDGPRFGRSTLPRPRGGRL